MRKVINKYIEKIFKTIPEIVFIVHDKIIDIISKYQKAENRELVLFWLHLKIIKILTLIWAVGEFI